MGTQLGGNWLVALQTSESCSKESTFQVNGSQKQKRNDCAIRGHSFLYVKYVPRDFTSHPKARSSSFAPCIMTACSSSSTSMIKK